MKKSRWSALALALVLASMPSAAGAAKSPEGNGVESGSTSDNSAAEYTEAAGSSGTVIFNGASVEVTSEGQITTVVDKGTDACGMTVSLVADGVDTVADNQGNAVINDIYVNIVFGGAETAGLPQDAVDMIQKLNAGADVDSLGLDGYIGVGGTRAVVAKNASGMDMPVQVSMKVDALLGANGAGVVYYNNNSGHWEIADVLAFDAASGIVTFMIPGSVTVKFARK